MELMYDDGGGLGIGQDKMLVTPLQIANGICIVANKGYYYLPHFVKSIDDENEDDTSLVNKFRKSIKCLRIFLMRFTKR